MRLRSDQRGTVSVITALGFTALLGAAAFGLDLSLLYGAQRRAQGAADLAAISAAANPALAEAAARRSLSDNGYTDPARIGIQSGSYTRSAALSEANRFAPGGVAPNAVRVSLSTPVRLTFGRFLGLPASYDVTVVSTAANARFAAFSVGSGVAALDAGLANALLGAMLGTTLSLRVLDYDALLTTRIDAFRFLDALALDLGLQAATYTDIIAVSATPGQITGALAAAALPTASTAAATALRGLTQALAGGTVRIPLRGVIDLGDAAPLAPERGGTGPAIRLFDILSAAASVANGDRQVSLDLAGTLPGLLGTRLTLAIGERRQNSGWVTPGSARATLRTAQVRLLIEMQLRAPLNLGTLSLPLYVEAASGQATLRAVSCSGAPPAGRRVELDVQPSLVRMAIGDVRASDIAAKTPPPNLADSADLLSLPLLSLAVRAGARASVGAAHTQRVSFTEADIQRHRERMVSSSGLLTSATGSLLGSLELEINGVGGLLVPTLRPLLVTTLSAVTPTLDAVLDATLRTLGLQLGSVTVAAEDARCEAAVLVQ